MESSQGENWNHLCCHFPFRSFPYSWLVNGFVTRLTRWVLLVEHELPTLLEHMSSPTGFSGVRVTRSLVLCVCFVDRFVLLSFFVWPLCCTYFQESYLTFMWPLDKAYKKFTTGSRIATTWKPERLEQLMFFWRKVW
jgi:hypothetical protein